MNLIDIKEFFYGKFKEKLSNEKSFLYFCSYVPIELIHALNFAPLRVIVETDLFYYSDEVAPKYLCPYLKASLEFFLKNDIKDKNIIFTDGCDSSRRFFEIFKELKLSKNLFYLKLPFNEKEIDVLFLKKEFEKIYKGLKTNYDRDKLIDSINLYNIGRKKLNAFIINENLNSSIKFYLNYLFQILEIEEFNNLNLSFNLEKKDKKYKFYLFSTIFPVKFVEFVESIGASIDFDDSCFGFKNLTIIKDFEVDPIYSLAKYYLLREGCVRKRDFKNKIERVIKSYKEGNYKGIIVYNLKYCDPLVFYIPLLKERLAKEKIPILIIDDDYTLNIKGQIRTRLEAFMEMTKNVWII